MQIAQLPRDLQAVVTRAGRGLKLIDNVEAGKWKCASDRIVLIEIAEAEQLGPGRTHVADLQRHGSAQRLLDVQVVILNVRRADIGIDGPRIAGGCEAGKDWHACRDGWKLRLPAELMAAGPTPL